MSKAHPPELKKYMDKTLSRELSFVCFKMRFNLFKNIN
jgi:hypothetical protein